MTRRFDISLNVRLHTDVFINVSEIIGQPQSPQTAINSAKGDH